MPTFQAPKDREGRLAWALENALALIRSDPSLRQDMQACWLFGVGDHLLQKPDWNFEWRYDGS